MRGTMYVYVYVEQSAMLFTAQLVGQHVETAKRVDLERNSETIFETHKAIKSLDCLVTRIKL